MNAVLGWQRSVQRVVLIALLAGDLTVGCGGDEHFSKGEYCSRLTTSLCDRFISCGATPPQDRPTCLGDLHYACCEDDNSCGERLMSEQQDMLLESVLTACAAALPTYDCEQLAAEHLPAECLGPVASQP